MSEPANEPPNAVSLELDCAGMPCPRPIIELGKHVADVEVGELISVLADDPAAAVDVPAWCRMRGQEFLGVEEIPDGVRRYRIRRLV